MAVALVCLWSIPVRIVKEYPESGPYKAFGWRESWAFIAVTVFLFLAGFFMVDFGDTEDSVNSVFTVFVGPWALKLSGTLFYLCVIGAFASYIAGIVVAVDGRKGAVNGETSMSGPAE